MALEGDDAETLIDEAYRDQPDTYNSSLLVCLPKKAGGALADGTPVYDPDSTRPLSLSLVNCDNRIVAAAAKRRWERTFANYVHPSQRGFLPGRSIVASIIDIDEALTRTAVKEQGGAAKRPKK